MAYPNPATTYTDIIATHNRYGEKMAVEIAIFNQMGMLIDQIKTDAASDGFDTQSIRWNPAEHFLKLHSGIYHYRMKITTTDGHSAVKTGELIMKN